MIQTRRKLLLCFLWTISPIIKKLCKILPNETKELKIQFLAMLIQTHNLVYNTEYQLLLY